MTAPVKQHLIDPEICIRCHTCEMTCPISAIEHDDNNVVVDFDKCDYCMACIPVCPTGSIDEWRVVMTPYTLEEQYSWGELPAQQEFSQSASESATAIEALDADIAELLAEAHKGAGGRARAPASASKPTINLYSISNPTRTKVAGNYPLTAEKSDNDVRHIILDFGGTPFPVLEGQSIGVIPPGTSGDGKRHLPRLYSVSSPRDGERPNFNNLSLTVKREPDGVCSNYLCNLERGQDVEVVGPFGSSFLMPNDPKARLLMICTGTGSAPFRAFTMRRQRTLAATPEHGGMMLFFGARTPDSLPYFGPLNKIPDRLMEKHLVFSRLADKPKEYVQDRLLKEQDKIASLLGDENTYIYICGLRGMEEGLERAFANIAESIGIQWVALRDAMRSEGRYHVETY